MAGFFFFFFCGTVWLTETCLPLPILGLLKLLLLFVSFFSLVEGAVIECSLEKLIEDLYFFSFLDNLIWKSSVTENLRTRQLILISQVGPFVNKKHNGFPLYACILHFGSLQMIKMH